jgi:uncharacterized membrane protein
MPTELILDIVLRWMHIFAALAAVGGMVFQRVALVPAVAELPEEFRLRLHVAVRSRWARVVQGAILFLLVSGLVNFVGIVRNYELARYYHALFGVKFLVAFGIFFISSMLTGRSETAQRFQKNARYWLTVNLLLAVIVVGISGILKTAPKQSKTAHPTAQTAQYEPEIKTGAIRFGPGGGVWIR